MKGHYSPNKTTGNELWGLAVYGEQKSDNYITVSDDATLRVWSRSEKKQVNFVALNKDSDGRNLEIDKKTKEIKDEHKGRSVTISPNG